MINRIVVPLDGSTLAEQALPMAEELSRNMNLPLHVVRVVNLGSPGQYGGYAALDAAGYAEAVESDEAATVEYLHETQARLADRGCVVTTESRRGNPAREVISLVDPRDLVVMATHGRGGIGRALMGSVADEIVRHAAAPTLLVRATGKTNEAATREATKATPANALAAAYEPW